jgi:uncharacterized membrane protein YbhN (UPF0104 family)
LPITPGGWGVGEFVTSLLLNGSGATKGANIMLTFRLLVILLAVVTGIPSYLLGTKPIAIEKVVSKPIEEG